MGGGENTLVLNIASAVKNMQRNYIEKIQTIVIAAVGEENMPKFDPQTTILITFFIIFSMSAQAADIEVSKNGEINGITAPPDCRVLLDKCDMSSKQKRDRVQNKIDSCGGKTCLLIMGITKDPMCMISLRCGDDAHD